jgi:hypothetical protein
MSSSGEMRHVDLLPGTFDLIVLRTLTTMLRDIGGYCGDCALGVIFRLA